MMTLRKVDEAEARANAATPGPWYYEQDVSDGYQTRGIYGQNRTPLNTGEEYELFSQEDASFIAAARSDVPALCETARRAIELLQRVWYADAGTEREIKDFLAQVMKEPSK